MANKKVYMTLSKIAIAAIIVTSLGGVVYAKDGDIYNISTIPTTDSSIMNTGNSIADYALSFLGVPYVWGGTTPSGFDCSGFVQYVYGHFGISIPRLSQDQQNFGTEILDVNDLQPGDLIFWGNPAYHVGMYIGNGEYVEAPHTGDVVKIATLYDYTSAQRIK
ncbi:C40 family peptidase [Clostridium sp. WILCCON 0269]|uniref:C40 family peptidase n=1 Tax=Candidatus Clostridium eludens TaxID=3381663 RepID=A0ABW8SRY8_9CLOT